MSFRRVWIAVREFFFFHARSRDREKRLVAVGGIHVFESHTPCRLVSAEPQGVVKDLGWTDTLALEARSEGTAEVVCGTKRIKVELVAPARLAIELVDQGTPTGVIVQERFRVQAQLYDGLGRELEVGKFTNFEWTCSGVLAVANDRSAGEFGFCDTCYGMHNFRALVPGECMIEARLGGVQGKLKIEASA